MDLQHCRAYVSDQGYYIKGNNIEVFRSVKPKVDELGQLMLDPLHHSYFVVLAALQELQEANISDRIMLYNDTRIVDDINGASSLDDFADSMCRHIRRRIVPIIPGMVWFTKCSKLVLDEAIMNARHKFKHDVSHIMQIAQSELKTKEKVRSSEVLQKMKKEWFDNEY